jgi:formylglycine-generating enzyme required for sulfatase activity
MSKEPNRRYQTAGEMADDLRRYLEGKPIVARPVSRIEKTWRWTRRNPVIASGSAVIAVLLVFLSTLYGATRPLRHTVKMTTNPEGASVVFIPIDSNTGEPDPRNAVRVGKSPVTTRLAPGGYLVIAFTADKKRFQEVFRQIPVDPRQTPGMFNHQVWENPGPGIVLLKPIAIPIETITEGMAFIEGSDRASFGASDIESTPKHDRKIPSYYLDPTEVPISDWIAGSRRLSNELKKAETPVDHAIVYVSWDHAVAYAEAAGKRLPDEFEYEYAATAYGRHKYAWGDTPPPDSARFGPVGNTTYDRLDAKPPVIGLCSNVAEWTTSWTVPYPTTPSAPVAAHAQNDQLRVVRGGTLSRIEGTPTDDDTAFTPRLRLRYERWKESPGIGFRCARSAKPRLSPDDFVKPVSSN